MASRSSLKYPVVIHILFVGIFLVGWAEMSFVGLMPIISSDLSVSVSSLAVVVSAYSISFAIAAPLVVYSARTIRKRNLLTVLMLVVATTNILTSFADSPGQMLILRVVLAAAAGAFAGTSLGTVSLIVDSSNIGRALGYILVGFGASLAFAVPGSVYLASQFTWSIPFLALSIFGYIIAVLLYIYVPNEASENQTDTSKYRLSLAAWKNVNPTIYVFQLATAFWIAGYAIVFTFLPARMANSYNYSYETVSIVLTVFGLSTLVGARIGGELVDRYGAYTSATGALICHSLSIFLAIVLSGSRAGLIFFSAIWGITSWASTPAIQAVIATTTSNLRDLMLTLNNSFLHLGIAVGAAIGAGVVKASDRVFYASSAVVVLGAAILTFIGHRMNQAIIVRRRLASE